MIKYIKLILAYILNIFQSRRANQVVYIPPRDMNPLRQIMETMQNAGVSCEQLNSALSKATSQVAKFANVVKVHVNTKKSKYARVKHLAYRHKDWRVRKKNTKRLLRWEGGSSYETVAKSES